ncbi:type II toxin-antitoxin system RelE family toxin [Geomonas oryzae]|uniref:type II toxin-antitoxin system RelE family toxin n=1 Tax=Geomonas oryzae TaxID=2364273 RepID=UPI00100B44C7|nr:type II toxin-antitoxin system RelE/ParE family toxin [Geomonas oryzae]
MSYDLEFKASALKEWRKLDSTVREQFKKRLAERLESPHVVSAQLVCMESCYKVKLRGLGYRLVYQVLEGKIVVMVVAVGKREHDLVYRSARERL